MLIFANLYAWFHNYCDHLSIELCLETFNKYFKNRELLKQAFVNITRHACGGTITICWRFPGQNLNAIYVDKPLEGVYLLTQKMHWPVTL